MYVAILRGSLVGLRLWGLIQWSPVRVLSRPLEVYPIINFKVPWNQSRCVQAGPECVALWN